LWATESTPSILFLTINGHLASAKDLHLPRPSTTTTRLRLAPGQAAAVDIDPVHHRHPHIWRSFGEPVLPRDSTPSDICYHRRQISTQFLVVRRALHHQLRRPTFNRHTARSPSGCMHLWCPCDPHRQTRRRQHHGCVCVYPVSGPACNLVFFRELLCNMAA
jgi:hypothetical protein